MKQLIQSLKDGKIEIVECPDLAVTSKTLIIETTKSLISIGTEKSLAEFGKASYLDKAKQQPEKVKEVFEKIKTDGIRSTIDAVSSKLNEPIPIGYSSVGIVREVGRSVNGFSKGDRVVTNGPHSTLNRMGENQCARIPDNVSDENASFSVVGSIALQSLRLFKPEIGEKVVVYGVGLIGLITVQMLIANGCDVLAIDYDEEKLNLAKEYGAKVCNLSKNQDPLESAKIFSNKMGVDGVIIAASTSSSDLISNSAKICRKRGRIILVGVVGLNLNRSEFYEKEITFQVSCSYGPGRYEKDFELNGNDYPFGYIRWTSKRNFEAVLEMISKGSLELKKLKSVNINFLDLNKKYQSLLDQKNNLGIVVDYKPEKIIRNLKINKDVRKKLSNNLGSIGFIGAGNYASRILLPSLIKNKCNLETLVNTGGMRSTISGERFGFKQISNNLDDIFENKNIDTVVIASRHDTHHEFVKKAIEAGKNIYVEKPLALNQKHIDDIENAYNSANSKLNLMVGFNRRFSPAIEFMKQNLDKIESPKAINYIVNSGALPDDHWTKNRDIGGGRIIGEACHFVDLIQFLCNSRIKDFNVISLKETNKIQHDTSTISLVLEDGSIANLSYFSNGSNSFPKEKIEVFSDGKTSVLNNFKQVKGYGPNMKSKTYFKQDKGHDACISNFIKSVINGTESPINANEIFHVSRKIIDISSQITK